MTDHDPRTATGDAAAELLFERLSSAAPRYALYLDFDGTLVDIVATPEAVHVPTALPALLSGLAQLLGGALALVSGRDIALLDAKLSPLRLPAGGGHGAQLRLAPGGPTLRAESSVVPAALRGQVAMLARSDPRLLYEQKDTSVALHFRAAPELESMVRTRMQALAATDPLCEVLPGRMLFELKRRGFDKGTAVAALAAHPPFSARMPLVIGDDLTDEHAIAAAVRLGGVGIGVGRPLAGAIATLDSPAHLRAVLARVIGAAIR